VIGKLSSKILFFFLKKKSKKLDFFPKNPKIIVMVSNTALGDTILSTPAMKSIHNTFPKSYKVAILNPLHSKLLNKVTFINEIHEKKSGYVGFFSTLFFLKKIKPEAMFIFHSNAPADIELGVISNIPFILKHRTNHPYKKYLSYSTSEKDIHTIENRLTLVRVLQKTVDVKIDHRLQINSIENRQTKTHKKMILFQMGSRNHYTRWPVEYFNALADLILEHDTEVIIGLTGEESEKYLLNDIKINSRVVDYFGKFSIEDLPSFVSESELVITNDTGLLHMAIAVGTPTISLFGSSDSRHTGPYQDLHKNFVLEKKHILKEDVKRKKMNNKGMRSIKVNDVFEQYKKITT